MELKRSKVTSNQVFSDGFFLLKVENVWGNKIFPGQFFQIRVQEAIFPLLSRPFSVLYADKETLWFLIKVVGEGTKVLSQKREGDLISLLGPLGKPFPVRNNVTLIAGGSGLAPLYFYSKSGHKTKKFLWGLKTFPSYELLKTLDPLELSIITEDGTSGKKGLVTDYIDVDDEIIYACGPTPMIKSLNNFKDKEILVSLESVMACGLGLCFGCAVRKSKGEGFFKVCTDGPVFNLRDILI